MSEIKDLLQSITSDNQTKAKEQFDAIIADKVSNALDARKVAVAQKRFNESAEEALEEKSVGGSLPKRQLESTKPKAIRTDKEVKKAILKLRKSWGDGMVEDGIRFGDLEYILKYEEEDIERAMASAWEQV